MYVSTNIDINKAVKVNFIKSIQFDFVLYTDEIS